MMWLYWPSDKGTRTLLMAQKNWCVVIERCPWTEGAGQYTTITTILVAIARLRKLAWIWRIVLGPLSCSELYWTPYSFKNVCIHPCFEYKMVAKYLHLNKIRCCYLLLAYHIQIALWKFKRRYSMRTAPWPNLFISMLLHCSTVWI